MEKESRDEEREEERQANRRTDRQTEEIERKKERKRKFVLLAVKINRPNQDERFGQSKHLVNMCQLEQRCLFRRSTHNTSHDQCLWWPKQACL